MSPFTSNIWELLKKSICPRSCFRQAAVGPSSPTSWTRFLFAVQLVPNATRKKIHVTCKAKTSLGQS